MFTNCCYATPAQQNLENNLMFRKERFLRKQKDYERELANRSQGLRSDEASLFPFEKRVSRKKKKKRRLEE